MDKRSWPWKKKSSEKLAAEKANVLALDSSATASDISSTQINKGRLDSNNKKPKYVQISMESYTHLTGLEDQVKSYEVQVQGLEDEVKELRVELSEAHLEMTNKENLVKQHAKVAEEAVSGWEKAEAEAATLKNHLESVTLLKLTIEDRASHLDGALKECMRQIRNLKEDHELKMQEVILSKTKIFDMMKFDLETQIGNLEQQLLGAAAENAAIAISLQERSNMLIKLSEEKLQAEAEIVHLKSNIESCEKEVNSLKYECHIARKEVEIRNEEKNMSLRSAEVANKHHLDGVKKIVKLEAECQRLRGLVRKKLPGPAALVQMKLEVENMGRDYGESHVRRSTTRSPKAHFSQLPESAHDNSMKYQKENELLTERLLAMDEEANMLKEALSKRNSELQTCRSIYALTASKLQSLESQLQAYSPSRSSKTDHSVPVEGISIPKARNPLSFSSVSECGDDDSVSCAGSCPTQSISEVYSYIQKDKNADTTHKSENNNHLGLMDDFLEMEKLAYQFHGSHEAISNSDVFGDTGSARLGLLHHIGSFEAHTATNSPSKDLFENQEPSTENSAVADPQLQVDKLLFVKLKSEISRVIESMSKERDMEKVIVDVRHIRNGMLDISQHQLQNDIEAAHGFGVDGAQVTSTNGATVSGDVDSCTDNAQNNQELQIAIVDIYSFVMILGEEAKVVRGASKDEFTESIYKFSAKYSEAALRGVNPVDFVLDMSCVLRKASKLHFNVLGLKNFEGETSISDCIDKIALPENKGAVDPSEGMYQNGCSHFSDSVSDPNTPSAGNLVPTSELTASSWKCSLEEFEELKMDKDNLSVELARCTEKYESTKIQLLETEQIVADVKSQLNSTQKFNTLADTQLKCMAESYKSLETRAEELQTQVNLLQGRVEHLDIELQEERRSHQDALNRCNDLLEQLQRIEKGEVADNDNKHSQEKELSAAAEKLAECQETIFLLGKQLKDLHPHSDSLNFRSKNRSQKIEASIEEEPPINSMIFSDHHSYRMDVTGSFYLNGAGSESPDIFDTPFSPSDSEAINSLRSNHPKHRSTKSSSDSTCSTPTPEKQGRGFSRFFSSKGKNAN